MERNDFIEALSLIDQYRDKCFVRQGSNNEDIQKAEKELGVKLPKSYKEFLTNFGYWALEGSEVHGLFNEAIIRNTKYERESNKDPVFPHSFVPIHALGNGEISCLDTLKMNEEGECPVVAWYFGKTERIAEDFGAFLLEKVKWGLESLKREDKKNEQQAIDKQKS